MSNPFCIVVRVLMSKSQLRIALPTSSAWPPSEDGLTTHIGHHASDLYVAKLFRTYIGDPYIPASHEANKMQRLKMLISAYRELFAGGIVNGHGRHILVCLIYAC